MHENDESNADELASYFEQMLVIPKPMSLMAEMMYAWVWDCASKISRCYVCGCVCTCVYVRVYVCVYVYVYVC